MTPSKPGSTNSSSSTQPKHRLYNPVYPIQKSATCTFSTRIHFSRTTRPRKCFSTSSCHCLYPLIIETLQMISYWCRIPLDIIFSSSWDRSRVQKRIQYRIFFVLHLFRSRGRSRSSCMKKGFIRGFSLLGIWYLGLLGSSSRTQNFRVYQEQEW